MYYPNMPGGAVKASSSHCSPRTRKSSLSLISLAVWSVWHQLVQISHKQFLTSQSNNHSEGSELLGFQRRFAEGVLWERKERGCHPVSEMEGRLSEIMTHRTLLSCPWQTSPWMASEFARPSYRFLGDRWHRIRFDDLDTFAAMNDLR